MKNLQTILASIFVTISLTEMTHPIILTGPARRNAHRQERENQQEQQYELHKQEGKEPDNFDDNDESVEVQSLDDENYADDAVVQIQSLGDGSIGSQLTPEQKEFIKGKLLEKRGQKNDTSDVTTQSISEQAENSDESNNMAQPSADSLNVEHNQSQEVPAPTQAQMPHGLDINDTLLKNAPTSTENDHQPDNVVEEHLDQAVQASSNLVHAVEQDQQEHNVLQENNVTHEIVPHEIQSTSVIVDQHLEQEHAADHMQPTLYVAPAHELHEHIENVEQHHIPAPLATEQKMNDLELPAQAQVAPIAPAITEHNNSTPVETIKIVKVYPVYEAVVAGIAHIKSAAFDMIQYIYSLMGK